MTGCACTESAVVPGCPVHYAGGRKSGRRADVPRSPDCRDDNHGKCDGVAWDVLLDDRVPCLCGCGCDG